MIDMFKLVIRRLTAIKLQHVISLGIDKCGCLILRLMGVFCQGRRPTLLLYACLTTTLHDSTIGRRPVNDPTD